MVAAGSTTAVDVSGRTGIPTAADAVMLNVAAVKPLAGGYLTVFACGGEVPNASNANYAAGEVVSNAVLTEIGDGGQVCVYSSAETHLVVDATGHITS